MKAVVLPKVQNHGCGDGNHAILMSLSVAHPEFVFIPQYVMDSQVKAFGEPEPAAVDEFDRGSVTPQTDMLKKLANLTSSQHRGQLVVIFGFDLGKDRPIPVPQLINEEEFG